MPRHRRRAGLALGGVAAVALAAVASASPAGAETLPLPLSGETLIRGHGYGHGHGMSQWGAYGAATKGLTHPQILSFYYPGTSLVQTAPGPMRVRLSGVPTSSLTVTMRPGLEFVHGGGAVALGSSDGGKPVDRWRLIPNSKGGQSLQWRVGSTWKTSGVYANLAGTPAFANSTTDTVLVNRTDGMAREYPDQVQSVRSGASLVTVNATAMERYLRGVVPNEMPASWPAAALRSQAVAARTYAAYEQQHQSSTVYDVCDTTSCQVYDGYADYSASGSLITSQTHPNADAAISATAGDMVSYERAAAFTQFSAANGGWMSSGSVPYLVAKPDPYDGAVPNSANSWTVTSTTARTRLQEARPGVGTLQSIIVTRDGMGEWGGRIRGVTLVGTAGRATLPWSDLRSLLGLKSEWFTVGNADFLRRDTSGDGRPDVWGRTADGSLHRFPFTGSGLGASSRMGGGWNVMRTIVPAGDLTGDGPGELLARDSSGKLWCYRVPRTGSLTTRTELTGIPASVDRLAGVGDVTSDGRSDLLGIDRTTGTLWLYAGEGLCGYTSRTSLGGGWNSMDTILGAADTDGDGRADLWARDASTGTLWTYRMNGSGQFIWPRVRVGGGWNVMTDLVALGEVNRADGADLLARDRSGALWLYSGSGNGTFGSRAPAPGSVSGMTILR
jgi:SpoIID/LytB domain protein